MFHNFKKIPHTNKKHYPDFNNERNNVEIRVFKSLKANFAFTSLEPLSFSEQSKLKRTVSDISEIAVIFM